MTASPNPWAPLLSSVPDTEPPNGSSSPILVQPSETLHANHTIHKQPLHWKARLQAKRAERKQQHQRDKQQDVHNFCSIISQHLRLLDQASKPRQILSPPTHPNQPSLIQAPQGHSCDRAMGPSPRASHPAKLSAWPMGNSHQQVKRPSCQTSSYDQKHETRTSYLHFGTTRCLALSS